MSVRTIYSASGSFFKLILPDDMNVQTIRTWNEIDSLSEEWNSLLERSCAPSIFLSGEWIRAWRRTIDDAVSPYVVTVRDPDGRLVGLAPLYVASVRILGVLNLRTLRFMADVATGSEYPDWIVDRDVEEDVKSQIARELCRNNQDWDIIWLPQVSGWTNAEKRIAQAAAEVGLPVRTRTCAFSAAHLPARISDFEAGFAARRRQQMRRNNRKIGKIDGVEFVRCRSLEELPEFLDALFDLHQRRWQDVGLDGCFKRKPVEKRFYREFAPVAFENGWLALFGIKQNGVFKAIQFGYFYDGAFLQLQEGYDPEFRSGAGNALRYHVINASIDAGMREYDFLAGPSEHKRRWSAKIRDGYDILIGSNSLVSRLMTVGGVWPSGRFAKQLGLVTQ